MGLIVCALYCDAAIGRQAGIQSVILHSASTVRRRNALNKGTEAHRGCIRRLGTKQRFFHIMRLRFLTSEVTRAFVQFVMNGR